MNCPKCQSAELDPSGNCPVCGPKASADPPASDPKQERAESAALAGLIEMDYASPGATKSAENNELPQWRQDLARRLHEIRQKRGTVETPPESPARTAAVPEEVAPPLKTVELHATPPEISVVLKPDGRPPKTSKPERSAEVPAIQKRPAPRPIQPPQRPEVLPLFQSAASKAQKPAEPAEAPPGKVPASAEPDAKDVRNLIDQVIARQAGDTVVASAQPAPRVPVKAIPVPLEDRLILVSRTLSGLVDLLIVIMCTGVFIIAADIVSGIHVFDSTSVIVYLVLLLATFFVYSAFFLGTATQTIGMMLTDLRVVDSTEKRPGMRWILWRCVAYLVSVCTLGAGLLWGLFDQRSRCLHDRLSNTHVIRL